MKKIILLCILVLCLSGCSKTENIEQEKTKEEVVLNTSEHTIEPTSIPTEKPTPEPTESVVTAVDNEVEIILSMLSMDGETTIEQYVEQLKTDNPNGVYFVYDDNHYCEVIKESERLEILNQFLSEEGKNEIFTQLNEQYPGVYLKIEPNEQCTEIKFYADLKKYNEADFAVTLTPVFLSAFYSEFVHAYSLVPIEERYCIVKIIDNETNEVIYTSEE